MTKYVAKRIIKISISEETYRIINMLASKLGLGIEDVIYSAIMHYIVQYMALLTNRKEKIAIFNSRANNHEYDSSMNIPFNPS